MERLVLHLYGFWFWLTRKSRILRYNAAAGSLSSAWVYLWGDYSTRASTRERGSPAPSRWRLLPSWSST
jgi:hypothetical protein